MGTRADFYVGRGPNAEWIGSIAYDGYPSGIPNNALRAETEADYRAAVAAHIAACRHGTKVTDGWPWPWEDSATSDYGYCFVPCEEPTPFPGVTHAGRNVWWYGRGESGRDEDRDEALDRKGWWTIERDYLDEPEVWPNMKHVQNVTMGPRSGLLILGFK